MHVSHAVTLGVTLLALGCVGRTVQPTEQLDAAATAPATTSSPSEARGPVQIEMRNVRLYLDEAIVLEIVRMRGEMVSTVKGRPPLFDDGRSYVLRLATADMSMDMSSLSALLNRYVFADEDAPLRDLRVTATEDGRLEQKGKLRKGIAVPFSMKAAVAATSDGRLRLHADSMKAIGIPAKGLLDLLGIELDELVDLKERRGLEVQGNDIIMAPGQIVPPPEMRGRLAHAAVKGDRLVLRFAPAGGERPTALHPPDRRARNYIYFSGGTIRFGKLTMSGADLQLIDVDPRDPFDFFPLEYNAQLVAGYSKNTTAGGLKTYMPDFADLNRTHARDVRPAARRQSDRRSQPR